MTPIEIRVQAASLMGQVSNVGLGGLLVKCKRIFPLNSGLAVRFNLPTGHSIATLTTVVHAQPAVGMGLRFFDLPGEYRRALSGYVDKVLRHTRRSARVARRFHVTLCGTCHPRGSDEELAETVLLSKHGGLLMSRSRFKLGERVFLWWPERHKGAHAKIVLRVLGGVAGLVELGFEFEDAEKFWEMEFPPDTPFGEDNTNSADRRVTGS